MDKATWGGVVLGMGGIVAGLMLEGGSLSQVVQPTAAIIVFGGTAGAVLVQFPLAVVFSAIRRLVHVFIEPKLHAPELIQQLMKFARQARRLGIVSLDSELPNIKDPFLRKSLMLAVDGMEPTELRTTMEFEMETRAEREEKIPQVFESAGGFSPTIGIIGAVLGLIQVMQHLDKIEEVGRGIAVAFVATIYGVGAANLFLLPSAGKLRIRIREEQIVREMTVEGVVLIQEGMNSRMLESRLLAFVADSKNEMPGPAKSPPLPERSESEPVESRQ